MRADTLEQQTSMVTEGIFNIIYGSERHMKQILLRANGVVRPLRYPGHSWKYVSGGELPP